MRFAAKAYSDIQFGSSLGEMVFAVSLGFLVLGGCGLYAESTFVHQPRTGLLESCSLELTLPMSAPQATTPQVLRRQPQISHTRSVHVANSAVTDASVKHNQSVGNSNSVSPIVGQGQQTSTLASATAGDTQPALPSTVETAGSIPHPPTSSQSNPKSDLVNLNAIAGGDFGASSTVMSSGNAEPVGNIAPYRRKIVNSLIEKIPADAIGKDTEITMLLHVCRSGRVLSAKIEQTTGDPDLDEHIVRAISALQLPPLPDWCKGDSLKFDLEFSF